MREFFKCRGAQAHASKRMDVQRAIRVVKWILENKVREISYPTELRLQTWLDFQGHHFINRPEPDYPLPLLREFNPQVP